jgi:integrase
MSVRKRIWRRPDGEPREAWVVDYVDQHGDRHLKTFARKRDADAYHAVVATAVRAGTHTADSKSVTVAKAGELWLESSRAAGLERVTLTAYRQQLEIHIAPWLGTLKLAQLTVPLVRAFEDRLRVEGRSPVMVRRVIRSLGALLADAQDRGLVACAAGAVGDAATMGRAPKATASSRSASTSRRRTRSAPSSPSCRRPGVRCF